MLKALRKDPAHRYPTAQALADDLNHWLRREPVSARPAAAPAPPLALGQPQQGLGRALFVTVVALTSAAGVPGTAYTSCCLLLPRH